MEDDQTLGILLPVIPAFPATHALYTTFAIV